MSSYMRNCSVQLFKLLMPRYIINTLLQFTLNSSILVKHGPRWLHSLSKTRLPLKISSLLFMSLPD